MADRLSAYADWLVANKDKRGTPEYDKVAQAYKQLRQAPVDRSFASAFASGIDAPLENMGITAEMLGAEGLGQSLRDMTDAPTNYESASNRFINPQEGDFTIGGFAPGYLPRAAVEQAGQLGGSLISRGGGAAVGAAGGMAVGGPGGAATGAVAGAIAGPALFEFVQQLGPVAQKRAANNGRSEPNWEDWSAAAATAGLSGALNTIGVGGGAGASMLNKVLREGVTEGAQSVTEQVGSSAGTDAGLQLDPKQAVGEGIIGGTTAGGFDAAAKTIGAVTPGGNKATDPEAAADLAVRLKQIIEANNLNAKDIGKTSTKGARQALDLAHSQIASEMKQLLNDLRPLTKVGDLDPVEVVVDKVMAEAGAKEARTKTKSIVGQQEYDATEKLVGQTEEGQKLLKLFRQSNELTELHNKGYIGGISQYTDQVSPFSSNVGYTAKSAAELPVRLLSTAAAASVNPLYPTAQIAAVSSGRAIDALTGRRSIVNKYVKDNAKKQGIDIGNNPSLRSQAIAEDLERRALEAQEAAEAAQEADRQARLQAEADRLKQEAAEAKAAAEAEMAEQKKQAALDQVKRGTRPTPGSPEETVQRATGLDRNGVAQILRKIKKKTKNKYLLRLINEYETSVATGGRIDDISMLIKEIDGFIESNPQFADIRVAKPDRGGVNTAVTAAIDPRIAQGKADNRAFNQGLQQQLNADVNVTPQTKAVANQALTELQLDLGRNPVQKAEQILQEARDKAQDKQAIIDYVEPYVARVRGQQPQQDDEVNINAFVNRRLPEAKPAKRNHRDIGEDLMQEQQKRYGRPLNPYDDVGDFNTIADAMTEEARLEFERSPDIATWYDDDIAEALATTAEIIPELKNNPDNKALFLLLAALTSVGHKPRINWRYAGALAQHYFATGEIGEIAQVYSKARGKNEERLVNPSTGNLFGLKAGSIEPGLRIFRHMVETMGVPAAIDWISSEKTKAEIDAMRKEAGYGPQGKIKGGKNAVVPGIQMFGPKVGPFYMNLQGISEVTVDVWASRTVRRHAGDLLDPEHIPGTKRHATDSGLIDTPSELERPTMKALYTKVGENLGVTPQAAQAILWKYEQELYNDLGATLETEKFSEGAVIFRDKDAVAYEERYPGSAARQTGGGEGDVQTQLNLSRQADSGLRSQGKIAGPRPADPAEVRDAQGAVKEIFEIGKPGSPYENGIPDFETAQRVAEALGFAMYLASNKSDLADIFGKTSLGSNGFTTGGANMAMDPNSRPFDRRSGQYVEGTIGVLDVYKNPRNPSEVQTPLQKIWVAMHELGHALEGRFAPGAQRASERSDSFRSPVTGTRQQSDAYKGTFRDVMVQLLNMIDDKDTPKRVQDKAQLIIDEIINLQRSGKLRDQEAVRPFYNAIEAERNMAQVFGDERRVVDLERQRTAEEKRYLQTPAELAADLIGMYLFDPQYVKKNLPNAAEAVQAVFNKGPVQFFSMPFASLLAVVLANMALSGEEEEEPGILTPQRGVLSA